MLVSTKSLVADSPAQYRTAQVRVRVSQGGIYLRFQVGTVEDFVEGDVPVTVPLRQWAAALPYSLTSLAKSGTPYAPCQIRLADDGHKANIRVQVPGKPFNRDYGAAFTITHGAIAEWLATHAPAEGKHDDNATV